MANALKVVLIILYCTVAYIATCVVSGGGHGTLAPILIAGSWPFLFLKLGMDAFYRLFSISGQATGMTVILGVDVVYIWLFLKRLFTTKSLIPFVSLVLFHLLGGLIGIIISDAAEAARYPAGNLLGYGIGFGLAVATFTILFFLNQPTRKLKQD